MSAEFATPPGRDHAAPGGFHQLSRQGAKCLTSNLMVAYAIFDDTCGNLIRIIDYKK